MFKVNNKNSGTTSVMSLWFWCFYCSHISVVIFEQVKFGWVNFTWNWDGPSTNGLGQLGQFITTVYEKCDVVI